MLTVADINKAEQNGIPPGTLNTRLQRGWDKERAINEPPRRTKKTYVAYRGGVEICRGSAEECSKKLGIKPETVRWLSLIHI